MEEPINGFCLYPSSAQIAVSKRYRFELRLNTKIVHHGSKIKINCNNSKIRVVTPEIKIGSEDGVGIIKKYVTVEGIEPDIQGILRANTGDLLTEAKIYVTPEKEILLDEGILFQPESLTLRPNQPRKVYLLVYIKIIGDGSKIKILSDNESVHISKNEIIVNDADANKHIAKYELEVWGEGVGKDAIITAEYEPYSKMALLAVCVRSKEEKDNKKGKNMFNEPEFNYDSEPLQRASYSNETGKVFIYVNFPSVKLYLGDNCQYRKTLPAQIFLADLVAERCFYEIARKKVDSDSALIRPEGRFDKIQSESYKLSRKHGKKVHELLVDQNLITKFRNL